MPESKLNVVTLLGSLREGSYNAMVARAAIELAPSGMAVTPLASIGEFPLYDADIQARGFPAPVEAMGRRIRDSDGVLIVSPEYNYSIPGGLKNAIDWLSRPSEDIARVFHDRPVAVLGATPGGLGTALAQNAWLPVLRTLRMRPWFQGRLMVSGAHKLVDEHGRLTDERTRSQVADFVAGFAAFVQESGTRSG
jgi:NAD(P)H-dependent FMN reductase